MKWTIFIALKKKKLISLNGCQTHLQQYTRKMAVSEQGSWEAQRWTHAVSDCEGPLRKQRCVQAEDSFSVLKLMISTTLHLVIWEVYHNYSSKVLSHSKLNGKVLLLTQSL